MKFTYEQVIVELREKEVNARAAAKHRDPGFAARADAYAIARAAVEAAQAPATNGRLHRRKVTAGSYELHDDDGRLIARADRTGEPGRDNYPWEWTLADGLQWAGTLSRVGGTAETLTECMDTVGSRLKQYGVTTAEGQA